MRSHGDLSEYFRVPKLGQHYTIKWANEDLEYERSKSAAAQGRNCSHVPILRTQIFFSWWTFNQSLFLGGEGSENIGEGGASDKMLKKGEAVVEKTPFGELTQRLVAGLIEDNLTTSGNPFSLNLWLFT